jgi:hypothetical protein
MKNYVYFMQNLDQVGLIKIGHSKDPIKRTATLQTGTGKPLRLLYSLECSSERAAKTIEAELHCIFGYCRRKGEWFTPNTPLRETIAILASGLPYTQARPIFRRACEEKWKKAKRKELRHLALMGKSTKYSRQQVAKWSKLPEEYSHWKDASHDP